MALATIPVLVERGVVHRELGATWALKRLRFFATSPQGPEPDATGYKGFYYQFLDFETGRRVWQCELSTIDSAFLLAGMLTVATYFDRDTAAEAEIRRLGNELYRRADWDWARDGGATLTHGWRPESGFIPHRWQGYDEGLLLNLDPGMTKPYGFKPSFNQTFTVEDTPTGWWVTRYHFGIDQGPVALMIENYRTGLLWHLMRHCPPVVAGLRRAGFAGGWLE